MLSLAMQNVSSIKLSYYSIDNTYKAVYARRCSNQIGNPNSLTTMHIDNCPKKAIRKQSCNC